MVDKTFLVRRIGKGQFIPRVSRDCVALVFIVMPPWLIDDRSVNKIGKKMPDEKAEQ
jgi:hypothetical protein